MFFLGCPVPVTLLEPSWLGPIMALAAVDICDKDNGPHNVLPSLVHPYLPGEEGLLKETYDKVGAHQSWLMKYMISTYLYCKVKPKDGQKTKARLFRVEPYTVLKCSSLVLISFFNLRLCLLSTPFRKFLQGKI